MYNLNFYINRYLIFRDGIYNVVIIFDTININLIFHYSNDDIFW